MVGPGVQGAALPRGGPTLEVVTPNRDAKLVCICDISHMCRLRLHYARCFPSVDYGLSETSGTDSQHKYNLDNMSGTFEMLGFGITCSFNDNLRFDFLKMINTIFKGPKGEIKP